MQKVSRTMLPCLSAALAIFLACAPLAQASFLGDVSSGLTSLISILNQNPAILTLEKSFCTNYFSQSSPNAFVSGFGSALCVDNVALSAAQTDSSTQATASTATSTSAVSATQTPSTTAATVTTTASTAQASVNETPDTVISTSTGAQVALDDGQILYWTNIARADNGSLAALAENSTLDQIAAARVADMFAEQYFSHTSPSGQTVATIAPQDGYPYVAIGENIALGNFGDSLGLVTAWMNSPDHRANILNTTYTQIGIAAEQGTYQGQTVWIADQVFGKPASACPSPSADEKVEITNDESSAATQNASLSQMQTQLAALKDTDPTDYDTLLTQYTAAVQTYNALVATLQNLVSQYNAAVVSYNSCIAS